MHLPGLRANSPWVVKLMIGNRFYLQDQCDPLTQKSIGVICWSWTIIIPRLKFPGISVLQLLFGNRFYLQGQCDLDLWPIDPKINRGYLLVMNNHYTKFKACKPKHSLVIDWKPLRSMWPWPLTPKSIGVICWSWTITKPIIKFFSYWSENIFTYKVIVTLIFDPLTQKWIGGHLLVMNNQHIKFKVPRPKRFLVITQKPFLPTRSMLPWPVTFWPKNQYGSSTGHDQSSYQVWSS
jgi:hypothetical protein